ncbi:MAG: Stp1/IreP family PP2C-type Ser/Thr phosphatase [Desulfobacteraceae bacterium]|nr:Stp1/IreP family PP2C-type Ser/Thr phosphatase [Desulfobacteraceae bacterium]
MLVASSGITNVGLKRSGNEDCFSKEDALGLYVVADGMGGHQAGEVASQIAVDLINKSFRRWVEQEAYEDELFGVPDNSVTIQGNYLLSSIRIANRVVYEMALEHERYQGMGTTVATLFVTSSLIIAANVGDSRIYLVRDGHIERLSKDHTIVAEQVEMGVMTEEEASSAPLKHVLTRNLGSAENVEAEIFEIEPSNNDRFILCSDGLTDLVSDREILEMAQDEDDPGNLCNQLVEKVLKRGAHDNTTVISVFLADMKKRTVSPLSKIRFPVAEGLENIQKIIKKIKP